MRTIVTETGQGERESRDLDTHIFIFCRKPSFFFLTHNRCSVVWEGIMKAPTFDDWSIKTFSTSLMAREHLRKFKVEHYWDMAMAQSIIESDAEEEVI